MFHHSANESQNARNIERTIESEQVQIYSKIAMQSKQVTNIFKKITCDHHWFKRDTLLLTYTIRCRSSTIWSSFPREPWCFSTSMLLYPRVNTMRKHVNPINKKNGRYSGNPPIWLPRRFWWRTEKADATGHSHQHWARVGETRTTCRGFHKWRYPQMEGL